MFLELDGRGSRQAQLTRALKTAVLSGRLHSGDRLPATRALATELGLSRNTVLASYEELAAEGFLLGKVGSGSYVAPIGTAYGSASTVDPETETPVQLSAFAQRAANAARRPINAAGFRDLQFNLQYGMPLTNPALTTAWRRELARAAAYTDPNYPESAGRRDLRMAVCDYLARRRGLQADPDDVLIVSGTQEAVALSARVLLDPGDSVVLEDPHYIALWRVFMAHGARVDTTPVDDEGLVCEQLPRDGVRLLCVTPSHQFPLGSVLSLPRRLALLRYAQANDAWILEDDYDGEFHYGGAPIAALRSLDAHDRTLYIGTFSKALFPALRMGYMVLPKALREPFRIAKQLSTFGCPAIEQRALAQFIENRGFERHLRRAAHTLRARRAALLNGLREHADDTVEVRDSQAGMHLVAWLRGFDEARLQRLIEAARERGVGLHPIGPCYLHPPPRVGLLLGYGGLAPKEISAAMVRFGEALRAV
ncbi:MAG TPA: PLP-dependent aminotransferase family protein [Lysobacter sp.]|jgi:GntR family transcriptional regulator/MocR family aminotransferase|nr:PLP-dependent aminotransferase family protein [Lysobacter sp.]